MSVNRPPPSAEDDKRNSKSATSFSSVQERELVDQRLEYLKEEVLPFYPFLLTVPTDVPFRLGSRFVNNWAVGKDGLFAAEEQQLQYMTFLTHHEGDSLLVAVGDWSDGTGNIMTDERSGPQSAASTPSNGSFKKKISLNDYKNKRKSGGSPSPPSQGTSTLHVPNDKQERQHSKASSPGSLTQIKTNDISSSSMTSTRPKSEASARKRPPENKHDYLRPHEEKHGLHASSPKRLRVSPEVIETGNSGRSKTNGLPTLLSPTLPPTSNSPKLPRLLSPTLPPDIEKELSTISNEPLKSKGSALTTTKDGISKEKSTDRDGPQLDAVHESSQKLNSKISIAAIDKHSSAALKSINTDPEETIRAHLQADKQSSLVSSNITPRTHTPSTNPKKPQRVGAARSQLVVKLRYGRSNRKRIEALLKFSGKRKAVASSPSAKESDNNGQQSKRDDSSHPKASISGKLTPTLHNSEKRVKQMSDEPKPSSRERSNELRVSGLEKPRTPVSSATNLTPNHQEKAKHTSVTPVKDPRNARQSESVDADGKTPSQRMSKYLPGDLSTGTKLSPQQATSQAGRSRNWERRAWKEEFQKYSNLGRELKHAAERHTAKDGATLSDEKIAAATAIEAILCFILAFVADDQSKSLARQTGDSSNWLSIIAYWRVVKKNSAPYPQLYSLCLILGALSYDAIHALDLERLAVSPLPGEHTPVPTPGGDGNTAILGENKRVRKEFLDLKNRLPECYRESQKLWLEGMQGLPEDVLIDEFPTTWAKRSKSFAERGKQRLKIGDYAGDYFLPLGRTNTPVEVVRFGWSALNEWCLKEGVEWEGRLGL